MQPPATLPARQGLTPHQAGPADASVPAHPHPNRPLPGHHRHGPPHAQGPHLAGARALGGARRLAPRLRARILGGMIFVRVKRALGSSVPSQTNVFNSTPDPLPCILPRRPRAPPAAAHDAAAREHPHPHHHPRRRQGLPRRRAGERGARAALGTGVFSLWRDGCAGRFRVVAARADAPAFQQARAGHQPAGGAVSPSGSPPD